LANDLQEKMLINEDTPINSKMTLMRKVVADNEQEGGDSTQVLDLFHRILAKPQKTTDMHELYAAYMTLKKMPQDSINQALRDALEIAPDNAGVRLELIQAEWSKKNFDDVIRLSRAAQEYNPDEMAFYYFMGLAHFQKDERDEALNSFQRGVAQINESSNKEIVSDFYAIMGDILHEKGREKEAYAAYDSCLQWKPDNIGCLNNYAYYLSEQGKDLQRAEQMSYRTIKAEPQNSTYLDTYAWILFMQERYEESKLYIDQAVQNDSTVSVVILEHAGDIHAKVGEMDKALDFWRKARDKGNDSKVLIRKIKLRKYLKK
jgi:tetratricopeptide (TPR) repeat protein